MASGFFCLPFFMLGIFLCPRSLSLLINAYHDVFVLDALTYIAVAKHDNS